MAGKLSYLEIGTTVAATSSTFFTQLFNWPFHPLGAPGEGWFDTPTCKAGLHADDPQPGINAPH